MQIQFDKELTNFETVPNEYSLYISVVKFEGPTTQPWITGPSSPDKNELIKILTSYGNYEAVRIYTVSLPLKKIPAT